ncbi:GLIPR1-like protein 1 [Mugil cephalus]|uniref:GLIPR1-like protein 1 n=1 Tax=Mugil cephalus TaxID=48193 RepID=UPI001FB7F35C|nr:GLIPR1-like protein 1 [Mugil cephalus]
MGSTVLLWVGVMPWIISRVCSVSLPEISDESFISECVEEHNRARRAVSPPASDMLYMTWDEGLAITARAWAKRCVFEHNIHLKDAQRMHPSFPSVGENIWVGYPPSSFSVAAAMWRWVNEKESYSYKANSCTDVCGHYTQVVWASSYKVGCAVQLCPNGVRQFTAAKGAIFVCNYATAGNTIGRQPYKSEEAVCSGCKGYCEDKLCRDQERDLRRRYNWTPDWDTDETQKWDLRSTQNQDLRSTQNTDSSYRNILIIRPIALIFTFITAYAVRYLYPDVFCYE